ncbi:MAG: hypothetical protein AB1546_14220 [bacterium]
MKIYVIASNTFREALKDRLIFSLLITGVMLILCSLLVAELAFVQRVKVITDVGLAAITLTGIIMAVFSASNLFAREIERKRIYSILSKPVARWQLVIGKYIGAVFSLTLNLVLMTIFLLILLYIDSQVWETAIFKAALLIEMELLVVAALAIFFSSFTSSLLSLFYSFLIFVAGNMIEDIRAYWQIKSIIGRAVAKAVYYIVPNLETFNIKQEVVHHLPVPFTVIGGAMLYGALYIIILIAAAVWMFQFRDLE